MAALAAVLALLPAARATTDIGFTAASLTTDHAVVGTSVTLVLQHPLGLTNSDVRPRADPGGRVAVGRRLCWAAAAAAFLYSCAGVFFPTP